MPEPDRTRPDPTRPGPLRRAARTLGVAALVAAVLLTLGSCMNLGERLAYLPSREPFATPPGVEDVAFTAADGTRLHAWLLRARGPDDGRPRPVVVHAHGNAGTVADHAAFSAFLADRGLHVFLFDYRGYGRSDDARPTRRALLDDTRAAIAAARAQPGVDPGRVGVYGVSLGGVFALHAGAEDPGVRAVATLSAFSTWRGVARDLVPLVGPLLIRPGLDPADAAARLGDRPYLIVHGDADDIVRPRHAGLLHAAATDAGVDARLVIVPGADHNAIIDTHPQASAEIASFFERHLLEVKSP